MRYLFKGLLAFNSIMILLIVYLIKESRWISNLGNYSIIVYFMIPILITIICLGLSNFLTHDSIEGGLKDIEMANDSYLPSYLGYFFVALSVPNYKTLAVVFGILFVFLIFSQNLYYNPLFLLFGYKFYYVTNQDGMKILLISRQKMKAVKDLRLDNLRRINYFTFIDKGEKLDESLDCEG